LNASRVRILVVDDFEPWRHFICSALSNESQLQIIGEVSDGLAAVQKAEELKPDLILLDIGLPSLNGIEAARRIRNVSPDSKILFISEHRSVDIAKEAIRIGGSGYVVKSGAGNDLLPALVAVLEGKKFASSSLGDDFFSAIEEHTASDSEAHHAAGPLSAKGGDADHCHDVAFYPNDESFIHGFASFAKSALRAGNPVVVVASKSHRTGILRRLRNESVDVDSAIQRGLFIEADAAEVLSTFMENAMPVANRVEAAANRLIAKAVQASSGHSSRIAICGELAPTLLAEGKTDAAMIVESYFDAVVRAHNLDVLCGYVLDTFPPERQRRIVDRICAEHSAVHMA